MQFITVEDEEGRALINLEKISAVAKHDGRTTIYFNGGWHQTGETIDSVMEKVETALEEQTLDEMAACGWHA